MLIEQKERPKHITIVHKGHEAMLTHARLDCGTYASDDGSIQMVDFTDGWYCGFLRDKNDHEYLVESHKCFATPQEAFDAMMANAKRVVEWKGE